MGYDHDTGDCRIPHYNNTAGNTDCSEDEPPVDEFQVPIDEASFTVESEADCCVYGGTPLDHDLFPCGTPVEGEDFATFEDTNYTPVICSSTPYDGDGCETGTSYVKNLQVHKCMECDAEENTWELVPYGSQPDLIGLTRGWLSNDPFTICDSDSYDWCGGIGDKVPMINPDTNDYWGTYHMPVSVGEEVYTIGKFYISNIDWGDGSSIEFIKPEELNVSKVIKHTYNQSGIYEVTGYMFRGLSKTGALETFDWIKRFVTTINVTDGDGSDDFDYFSSGGFTYYPLKDIKPIIGGISKHSTYYKNLSRQTGYIGDEDSPSIDVGFKHIGDRLKAEKALMEIDDTRIGETVSSFLSPYYDSSIYLSEPPTSEASDYGSRNCNFDAATCDTDTNCSELFIPSTGEENYCDTATGEIDQIFNQLYFNYGEFGSHLGHSDIGQIRYFNKPMQMWEMLGFEDTESGTPDSERYWQNIIPEDFDVINDRMVANTLEFGLEALRKMVYIVANILSMTEGYLTLDDVSYYFVNSGICPEDEDGLIVFPLTCPTDVHDLITELLQIPAADMNDTVNDNEIEYDINEDGIINITDIVQLSLVYLQSESTPGWVDQYYYPVLPVLDSNMNFDDSELQGDSEGNEHIPFGSPGRAWDEDDTEAPITNEDYTNDNLIIYVGNETIEQNVLEDKSGNQNIGMVIADYRINYDSDNTKPEKDTFTSALKIDKKYRQF
jgi:hypothetical protein